MEQEFESFGKIARLNREIIITEKIDGTNAQIFITPDGSIKAGSRTRWITPDDDNFGFARWVYQNKDELLGLGEGRHYGEWWGSGIQRKYGQDKKIFSLFNTNRWVSEDRPACCDVVPVLYQGAFYQEAIEESLEDLRETGSKASPGFDNPEGIIIWHTALREFFKVTLEKDEIPKFLAKQANPSLIDR